MPTVTLEQITGHRVSLIPATEKSPGAISSQATSPESDLGEITWTGLRPPTVLAKRWRSTQSGNMAVISGYIKCSSAGQLITALSVPFPAGAPIPWLFEGMETEEWVARGTGAILESKSSPILSGQGSAVYRDFKGLLTIRVNSGGVNVGAKYARFFITYLVGD